MLNIIWAVMIISGVAYGVATGNVEAVSNSFVEGGQDAIDICITMFGVVSLWTGLMNIADKSGVVAALEKKTAPIWTYLFPDVPKEHPAFKYIAVNMIANFCGLGWAATPAGLEAVKHLSALEDERCGYHSKSASDAMCAFLVINISSIQLIPITVVAYRAKYGSVNPAAVILPGIIATFISTLAAVIFIKIKYRKAG